MDIRELAHKYEPYVIERRRYYHANPELPEHEEQTRAQAHKDLEAIGITDIKDLDNCFGLVATIHGGKPGRTIGLRADIDCLPVKECTGYAYASKVDGISHACGHDTHLAMLLGAAQILNEIKDELCGDVRLLVQPAEELASGALNMVKAGALEGVDAVYGQHVMGTMDCPLYDCTTGTRMACCHSFTITVNGVSAHGSAPHLGVDAIAAGIAIANNLQQVVSRYNDPTNPLVLTIGTFNGGSRFNIVANKVTMTGTVRTFLRGTEIEDEMRRVVENTAAALRATATLDYVYMTPPLINDNEELNQIAHDAAVKLFGEEGIGHTPTMMGSEDFPWMGENGKRPYFYGLLGTHLEGQSWAISNHHEEFLPPEELLWRGSAMMAQFAADYLNAGK